MRITRSSRAVRAASARVVASRRLDWIAASIGKAASLSSMKSPSWDSSSSPTGVRKRQWRFRDLKHMPHLFERHMELLGDLFGRRLTADLIEQLPARSYDVVQRCPDVPRNADGARLVDDRTADRLADPPNSVGPELIAALIIELVYRL